MSGFVNFQSDSEAVWQMLNHVSGKLAFDIGANGGLVSRTLAERFETVIACEPATESYSQLIENIPPNVKPLNVAVSDKAGEVVLRETTLTEKWGELFTDDTLSWGDHTGYRTVPCVTLDELSEEYGYPDFVKIDTEGHEVHILVGGTETFYRGCRFVIEVHSVGKGATIRNMLRTAQIPYVMHNHMAYRNVPALRLEHFWITSPTEEL